MITAAPIDDVRATTNRLVLVTLLAALGVFGALGVVSWWMIRLGIRPVKEMTMAAAKIAEGDLSVRIADQSPGTEPGELAIALNRMLGQIEGGLQSAQSPKIGCVVSSLMLHTNYARQLPRFVATPSFIVMAGWVAPNS